MRLERGTALAGFAFVAATLGNVITESAGPDITSSASSVTAAIGTDRGYLFANSLLHIAQGISVILFAAGLTCILLQRGSRLIAPAVVLGCGVITAAGAVISAVLSATVASSIHHLHDGQPAYLLYRGARTTDAASTIFFAVTLAATVMGLERVDLLPKAMTRIGLIVVAVFFAGGLEFLAPDSGPLLPVETLGGILALIYMVAVSVRLLRLTSMAEPGIQSLSTSTAVA